MKVGNFSARRCLGKKSVLSLDAIGRSMVEKCGGLPLAVVTLAGIVAKKKRLTTKSLSIKHLVIWHLAKDKSKIMEVRKLSYDNLPQRLKPYYLYFGIYPKDYEIPMRELFQLWIDEGFIRPQESGISNAPNLEYVAKEYLNELVDRSLVQVATKRSDGHTKVCRIHDLLCDLCILESKADKDLEICIEVDINFMNKSKSYRLSLRCTKLFDWCSFAIQCDYSHIHSLMCFDGEYIFDPCNIHPESFNSARILDFVRLLLHLSIPRDLNMFTQLRS